MVAPYSNTGHWEYAVKVHDWEYLNEARLVGDRQISANPEVVEVLGLGGISESGPSCYSLQLSSLSPNSVTPHPFPAHLQQRASYQSFTGS